MIKISLLVALGVLTAACVKPSDKITPSKNKAAKATTSGKQSPNTAATAKQRARIATAVKRALDRAHEKPQTPAATKEASSPLKPAPDLPPAIQGPIPAVKLVPLNAKLSAKKIIQAIRDAHYDAERLGLRQVDFSMTYVEAHKATKVTATGRWKSGGPPDLTLKTLSRENKTIAKDTKRHEQMHQAMTFRLRRLLQGLGKGFLSQRIADWLHRDGKVRTVKSNAAGKKKMLEIVYAVSNEFNHENVTLLIDAENRVERVTRTSDRGVTRTMRYHYRMVGGRNLVTRGEVSISFGDNAKIKGKLRTRLMATDDMNYQFTYKKIGRFYLPTQIYRRSPKLGRRLVIELTYTQVG
ncbi:MAG: hypothetical protein KAI47_22300 [Deltaproteobacteria bacterium]|nr:hypothetical protein [Deltaproteobacteria bacterium]